MYSHTSIYQWTAWTDERDRDPGGALMTDQRGNPLPRFDGFEAEILVNPIGRQAKTFRDAFNGLLKGETSEDELYSAMAPFVRSWNYEMESDDGVIEPVPAPGEIDGNAGAFHLLEMLLTNWIVFRVNEACLPKVRQSVTAGKDARKPDAAAPIAAPASAMASADV